MSSAPSIYPLLHNARLYTAQRLQSRPGMAALATGFANSYIHSIRRLNDPYSATFARILGIGTGLFLATGASAIDTGYSGNPLSLVPFRPSNSPQTWMYVGDQSRMRKVNVAGTNYQMGIAPPQTEPSVFLGGPAIIDIEDFVSVGSWTNGGTAGSISTGTDATDITVMVFDTPSASTGWATVMPTSPFLPAGSAFAVGQRLTFTQGSNTEIATIQEVLPAVFNPSNYFGGPSTGITIAAIVYDSGTSGMATITLNVNPTVVRASYGYTPEMDAQSAAAQAGTTQGNQAVREPSTRAVGLRPNCGVLLDYGTGNLEFARVVSVSQGPSGEIAFRCNLQATHAAGANILFVPVIRVNLANTYAVTKPQGFPTTTATIADHYFSVALTAGTGYISEMKAIALDIVAGQELAIQEDDIISLMFQIDNAANLTEIRLIFDVDSSDNDFEHTYYFKSWTAADLQAALSGSATIQAARLSSFQTQIINENVGNIPNNVRQVGPARVVTPSIDPATVTTQGNIAPTSTQASPVGLSRWLRLSCKVSDLTLVGTDGSATLANVQGIKIQVTVAANATCYFDALWMGGCFGPDIGTTGVPYLYRYQPRSSFTGAMGYPSPPTRSGIEPHRQIVDVYPLQHPDPQVDTLDIYRWGGVLPQWTYVGSCPNAATPFYEDIMSDTDIESSPQLQFTNLQPFPTIDVPHSGVVTVAGTVVQWVSGAKFNLAWAAGSQIQINGIYYTLFTQPATTELLQIVENAGTQTSVPFSIQEATLLGQPLPVLWGPYSQGTALYLFACGDTYQPGVLFLTNGNDPDSASDVYQIEITSPSEPLMNGVMYNGQSYVWSSERLFFLYPSFGSGIVVNNGQLLPAEGTNLFVPQEVPNGKGLFARYALCAGPKMWFRARDGIYETTGGEPVNITSGPLALLFPHDGQPGQPVTFGTTTIYPPDDTKPNAQRLAYYDSNLYFDYIDTNGAQTTLVANTLTQPYVWSKDDYTPQVVTHYGEEGQSIHSLLLGGAASTLWQATGNVDGTGAAFPFEMRMPQMSELSGSLQHVRDGYLGLIESAAAALVINVDGVDNSVALPSIAGEYERVYTPLPAVKGRLFAWALTGTSPFAAFMRDCEMSMRTWGDSGAYKKVNPFASFLRAVQEKVE